MIQNEQEQQKPFLDQNKSKTTKERIDRTRKSHSSLTIATCNIEGVKSNSQYLLQYRKAHTVIDHSERHNC